MAPLKPEQVNGIKVSRRSVKIRRPDNINVIDPDEIDQPSKRDTPARTSFQGSQARNKQEKATSGQTEKMPGRMSFSNVSVKGNEPSDRKPKRSNSSQRRERKNTNNKAIGNVADRPPSGVKSQRNFESKEKATNPDRDGKKIDTEGNNSPKVKIKNPNETKNKSSKGPKHYVPNDKDKKESRNKVSVFRVIISTWAVLICIASSVAFAWGYSVWKDASVDKIANEEYSRGRSDSQNPPTFDSMVRVPYETINQMMIGAPGARFPANPIITDHKVIGWTEPGGSEKNGSVEIEACYIGDGVDKKLKSTAYLVSDDVTVTNPIWSVDSVSVTGENCSR